MELFEFLLCAALVAVSAFMSCAEIALFSLSRFQLRALKDRARSPYRKIKRLLGDPGGLLITILVLNEVINIALASIITESLNEKPGIRDFVLGLVPFEVPSWALDTLFGILVTTPVVLILCEITPKTIAARANELVAPLSATPLAWFYDMTKPARVLLTGFVGMVGKASGTRAHAGDVERTEGETLAGDESESSKLLKESDFLLMLEEGQKEGAVQQTEVELIKNVFELDDTKVADIATPISQVLKLTELTTVKTALQMVQAQKFSRVPVSSANRKQIVGVLYTKDLLKAKLEPEMMGRTVASIMKKPLFVSPTLRLNSFFRKFKQQKTHLAIVQAQGAGAEPVGIVTMSDVLDSLLEDVLPEDGEEHDE